MKNGSDIDLMAHLLRRVGFGATRDELDAYLAKGYEATVEELLHPQDPGNLPDDIIMRYHVEMSELRFLNHAAAYWLYRIVTTKCPLEEKIALFWHGIFATGYSKLNQARSLLNQIDIFRRHGLGSFRDLLIELSKDPAMIIWLDNQDNHKGAINENYGRELLELFSMGVGNYTEQDIKECARAFTGWTLRNAEYMAVRATKDSIWPYGRIAWHFEYRDWDHDDGEKVFLGERGRFNGEEIVDIICRQPATARFISRHLYDFFVADEAPVPQWPYTPPRDPEAIEVLSNAYFESNYDIRSMLRVLFNSDFFKSQRARYARVKSPVELVAGAVRLSGDYQRAPSLEIVEVANHAFYMGQGLLQPPTVEGWHEGLEWIDSGALIERVNFVSRELSNLNKPGVRAMVDRLASMNGGVLSPEMLVDGCLDLLGHLQLRDRTRAALVARAAERGDLDLRGHQPGDQAEQRVAEMLRLIASTREFQLC